MLALLLLSAFGSFLAGMLISIFGIDWHVLVASLFLQIIGLSLMTTLPVTSGPVPSVQFGYQVILGLGFGLALSSLAMTARVGMKEQDISQSTTLEKRKVFPIQY